MAGLLLTGLALILVALTLFVGLAVAHPQTAGSPSLAGHLGAAVKGLVPKSMMKRYEHLLLLAGSPRHISIDTLIGLKALAAPIGALAVLTLFLYSRRSALSAIPVALLAAIGSIFLPDLWLSQVSAERQATIRKELPDTLDLLTINVEAGLGFDAALSRVVANMTGALSEEFSRLLREIQLGRARSDALKAMMDRTKVLELNSFILAILEADRFGISIAQTLRSQSHELRIRRRQRAEEMAIKTPVKMVFPLILCIFPTILLVVVGPAGIRIARTLGGG